MIGRRRGSGFDGKAKLPGALWILLLLVVAVALFAAEAQAQQRELRVPVSSAKIVDFRAAARSVFIADPAIADIQVASPDSVIVFGRKPGQTTLIAMGANDKPLANIQVVVSHSSGDLRRLILQDTTAPDVKVTPTPNGIVLSVPLPTTTPPRKSPRRRSAMSARRMSSSIIWKLPRRSRLICRSASPRSSAASRSSSASTGKRSSTRVPSHSASLPAGPWR